MERTFKKVLVEYADMKEEIEDLRKRIGNDRKALRKLKENTVADSVSCGKKGKRALHTVTIYGQDGGIKRKQRALEKKIGQLEDLETELIEKQMEVEEYIEGIKESKLRTMFRIYYIDGLTWERTADRMNEVFPKKRISYTKDSCRKLHDRYFEKNP